LVAEAAERKGADVRARLTALPARSPAEVVEAFRLTASGMVDHEAHDLATTLITLLEGAHVLCRATSTSTPSTSSRAPR
jgi:hypothetical protein